MPLSDRADFACPYCGEINPLHIDLSAGRRQSFVVDCGVCCSPIAVRLTISHDEAVIDARPENG